MHRIDNIQVRLPPPRSFGPVKMSTSMRGDPSPRTRLRAVDGRHLERPGDRIGIPAAERARRNFVGEPLPQHELLQMVGNAVARRRVGRKISIRRTVALRITDFSLRCHQALAAYITTDEGTKMASVATTAPAKPQTCQPMRATISVLGPGAARAMANRSANCWLLSQACTATVWC